MEEKSVNNFKMLFLPLVLVLIWSKQENVFALKGKNNFFRFFFFFLENGYVQSQNASTWQLVVLKEWCQIYIYVYNLDN